MAKAKLHHFFIHLAVWAIYIAFPAFVLPRPFSLLRQGDSFLTFHLTETILSIIFFYFNFSYAIPRFFFTKKYSLYFLSIVLILILLSLIFRWGLISFSPPPDMLKRPPQDMLIGGYIHRMMLVFVASFGLRFYMRNQQIEYASLKSELQSLKSQIQPHFLFNTLNNIYGQAISNSPTTADSIFKLSAIMRYVLTETDKDKVELARELEYIEHYIALQKIRLTSKTQVTFEVVGNWQAKEIAPLLLIGFIENAFKYGISTEFETEISIKIDIQINTLLFEVKNTKITTKADTASTHIGLTNIKKRLELLYKNNYVLDISETEKVFFVRLMLQL
ncbi:MAG: sensor histidine kinase [Thermonemataceae bacterium]|nr:sensor histidine kinase [Thermonemataceae bacterium]